MKRSKSSRDWLDEHFNDIYVKRAQAEGYRSRSAFKLIEIQEKDRLLRAGMKVVDLGAAPGGWTQVATRHVGAQGKVVALDCLAMDPVPGVVFIQGDFTFDETLARLQKEIDNSPINLVMSDMAPNLSGMAAIDQPRAMYLAELALDFAQVVLVKGGDFLTKVFQGEGYDAYVKQLKTLFQQVVVRKPKASRPRSKEVYLLARGFRGVSA